MYSFASDHEDAGYLGIYTAVNREQEALALDTARAIVLDLAEHGPTQAELDRAREQARANLLMGSESVQTRMSHLGADALLFGRVRTTQELLERYDAVQREDLRALAGEIFSLPRASLSALGRVRTAGEYSAWLGRE